jgi:hypothetical protein
MKQNVNASSKNTNALSVYVTLPTTFPRFHAREIKTIDFLHLQERHAEFARRQQSINEVQAKPANAALIAAAVQRQAAPAPPRASVSSQGEDQSKGQVVEEYLNRQREAARNKARALGLEAGVVASSETPTSAPSSPAPVLV